MLEVIKKQGGPTIAKRRVDEHCEAQPEPLDHVRRYRGRTSIRCLGCAVCFPANAFADAFPEKATGLDLCPTEAPEERTGWPPLPGDYKVIRYRAAVAVCALNSSELAAALELAAPPGASIVGTMHTENLGIERLIRNVLANPNIRFLPLVAGAHMLGFLRLPTLKTPSLPRATGMVSAFLAGLLLALVFGPCGTPLLAGLLSYAAFSGNPAYGGALLFLYGIGISIPVVVLGASAAKLAAGLERNGRRIWVDRATGGLLVTMGLYVIWSA